MDDRDEWEDEDTVLDEYQRQKELEEVALDASFPRDAGDTLDEQIRSQQAGFGVGGALQRMSYANNHIIKALQANPGGWMVTSINQQMDAPVTFHGFQLNRPNPEAEVNIRVSDPQLIATLHHAMQGYC